MSILSELRWSPYLVGAAIGVLSWFSFLLARQPISCSTSFARTSGMIERALRGKKVQDKTYYQKFKLVVDWQWMLVAGIVIGAFLSALLSGDLRLQWIPALWQSAYGPNPLLRLVAALIGGIFLGFGARWANGCTSGHGISGT
ncbi:YeeE/YedE family protein, partial [candidate division KSB1 bacterium]|nr:YeeE/YedE family protein [candidate division KSB1 bacterium]